ncbi:MAG TPA: hypothetical protein PLZ56_05390 [Anaerolineae bacterium]|nr:hypothetical protein [Anaerolineae bacterium]
MTIQDIMLVIAIVTMVIALVVAGVAMERRMKDPTIALVVMGARRSAPLRVQLKMLVFILVTLGTLALVAILWRGVG